MSTCTCSFALKFSVCNNFVASYNHVTINNTSTNKIAIEILYTLQNACVPAACNILLQPWMRESERESERERESARERRSSMLRVRGSINMPIYLLHRLSLSFLFVSTIFSHHWEGDFSQAKQKHSLQIINSKRNAS